MIKKLLLTIAILFTFSASTYANKAISLKFADSNTKIVGVGAYSSGSDANTIGVVYVNKVTGNTTDKYYMLIRDENGRGKALMSTAIAAMQNVSEVQIQTDASGYILWIISGISNTTDY